MVTPIWKIQRELKYAQAREAYYADTTRPIKSTVDAQPRTLAVYRSSVQRIGGAAVDYRVNISQKASTFFGGLTALGLIDPATAPEALPKPSNFKPATVKAMVGDATPTPKEAYNGTGRRYIKYSANTAGEAQSHYQSPISGTGATPTWDDVVTKFNAISTAKGGGLGVYGRLYLEPETFSLSGR